jgi:hypothetical protein
LSPFRTAASCPVQRISSLSGTTFRSEGCFPGHIGGICHSSFVIAFLMTLRTMLSLIGQTRSMRLTIYCVESPFMWCLIITLSLKSLSSGLPAEGRFASLALIAPVP